MPFPLRLTAVTNPSLLSVSEPVERDCPAATIVFASVAVDADSSMGVVVDLSGEPWVAFPEDEFWDVGGVPGRLVLMREEMHMGLGRVVMGFARCACAVRANEFRRCVREHDGGIERGGRADMFGEDGWR